METNTHNLLTTNTHTNRMYLTPLQQEILKQMLEIHAKEDRAICYLDLDNLDHDTIRFEFRELLRKGAIERATSKRTCPAFYKVKGASIRWDSLTTNHRVGQGVKPSQPIQDILNTTPYGPQKMHNMRFRFHSDDIYPRLRAANLGKYDPSNKTVILGPFKYSDFREYRLHCYSTGYCVAIVGCSLDPIRLDTSDIMAIPAILSDLRGALSAALDHRVRIPAWETWTMIYCEVGRDSITQYNGERFQIQVNEFVDAAFQYYTKQWPDGKVRIRKERQHRPNKPAVEALAEFKRASQLSRETSP